MGLRSFLNIFGLTSVLILLVCLLVWPAAAQSVPNTGSGLIIQDNKICMEHPESKELVCQELSSETKKVLKDRRARDAAGVKKQGSAGMSIFESKNTNNSEQNSSNMESLDVRCTFCDRGSK